MSNSFNSSWYNDVEDVRDENLLPSPNYSLRSEINSNRIGSAIPILHGTHKITPDLASQPYTEAQGGNNGVDPSITKAIYTLGLGKIEIAGNTDDEKRQNIFIGDNPVDDLDLLTIGQLVQRIVDGIDFTSSNFSYQTLYVPGNARATIPNTSIVNADYRVNYDVENIEITNGSVQSFLLFGPTFFINTDIPGDFTPFFTIGNDHEGINTAELDFVAPDGLWTTSTSASVLYAFARNALQIQVQRFVNNAWVTVDNARATPSVPNNIYSSVLDSYVAVGNTRARYNFRLTFNFGNNTGRYRFRVRSRGISTNSGNSAFIWNGLRGRVVNNNKLQQGITYLLVAIRTSERFTSLNDLKLSAICRSKGNIIQANNTITNNNDHFYNSPIDAVINILGALNWPANRIDKTALGAIKTTLATRGDTYNAVLDRVSDAWTTIKNILKPYRCIPVINSSGTFTIVRDDTRANSVALFTQRSISENTFSILQSIAPDEVKDGVTVRFTNSANNYQTDDISVTATGGIPTNPKVIRLRGITNATQARKEALYRARVNAYRRQEVKFVAEAEGLLLNFGDKVLVQHDLLKNGDAGDVVDAKIQVHSGAKIVTLELSEPITTTLDPDQVFNIVFRTKQGGVTNVFTCRLLTGTFAQIKNADLPENQQILLNATSNPTLIESADKSEKAFRLAANAANPHAVFYGLDGKAELTHYAIGVGNNYATEYIVKEAKPVDEYHVRLTLDLEDNRIYTD